MLFSCVSLFLMAFLAATILPLSSEAVLVGLNETYPDWIWIFVIIASLGNILGSVVNWLLGRWLVHFKNHKWFPVSENALTKAEIRFKKWGWPSLLLAWVPVIGDPLTLIAGMMNFPFRWFILLITLSKGGRYLIIAVLQRYLWMSL